MAILYIKIFHLLGVFCLFAGFGGLFGIGENRPNVNKAVAALHGTGLLLLFLTGFAMQGMNKAIEGFPGWLITKIVIWILMVGLFVFVKRGKMAPLHGILLSILLGIGTAYLCFLKPF